MHRVSTIHPIIKTDAVLFYVAQHSETIPGGPTGVWITNEAARSSPELLSVERNGVIYRFITIDPLLGSDESSPIALLERITSQAVPTNGQYGNSAAIDIYAEWTRDAESTGNLLEAAIEAETDPDQVIEIGRQLLSDSHSILCGLVRVLRRKYSQYWLIEPTDLLRWSFVRYYSPVREGWYSINVGDDFAPKLLGLDWKAETCQTWQPHILFRALTSEDKVSSEEIEAQAPMSVAEELVATALVDLKHNRKRSAIIHATAGLEACVNLALDTLLRTRLSGLEQGSIVNAISKEVGLNTLARVVYFHVKDGVGDVEVNWQRIKALCTIRNEVIHRGRRRLPTFRNLQDMLTETYKCVTELQRATLGLGTP